MNFRVNARVKGGAICGYLVEGDSHEDARQKVLNELGDRAVSVVALEQKKNNENTEHPEVVD